jgi:hypothetical protein
MSTSRFAKLTRWFLYLLIASIGVGAMLAMGIVMAGDWSWFEIRILLTTGTVAAASICGMASAAALSRGRSATLPAIGIGLALLAGATLIAGMWFEVDSGDYWRFTASVSSFAVTVAHVAVLLLARLRPSHAWIQLTAAGAALVFAAILVLIITSDTAAAESTLRALAVVGIADVAFSLMVPIMHFLDRRSPLPASAEPTEPMGADARNAAALDREIARLGARLNELERQRAALLAERAATHPVP